MTGPDGATPPSHGSGSGSGSGSDHWISGGDSSSWQSAPPTDPNAGAPNSWESFAAAGSGPGYPPSAPSAPGPGGSVDLSGVPGLLRRQFVIPAAALAVAIIAVVISASAGGGGNIFANSSSDAEVCSAYRAAERSWDSWDTDATEVEKLGSVASKHSDADVRSAGESLNNLTGMFSYGRYSSIVQPIQRLC